jgi:Flp pilus assembly protein TadD
MIAAMLLLVSLQPELAFGAAPEEQFKRAVSLLGNRQFEEAVPLLEAVLEAFPEDPAVLWNYGIAAAEIGAHEMAALAWKRYRTAAPDDWRARAKLVQAY